MSSSSESFALQDAEEDFGNVKLLSGTASFDEINQAGSVITDLTASQEIKEQTTDISDINSKFDQLFKASDD